MSYDMIDRFLRNNLHDEDYAEFSAALDAVIADAAAAHAQGLRERIAELERDNANLKTVMVAAAEEIHAHWDAHCDAEGYGPQNLMRRLEEGIPSEYGYTAGAFAAQQKRISELEAQRVPLTKAEITACCNESDTYKTGVWMRVHETTLERLVRAIERAHGVEPTNQRCSEAQKDGGLWDAESNCDGEVTNAPGGGVRCTKCRGWFCY